MYRNVDIGWNVMSLNLPLDRAGTQHHSNVMSPGTPAGKWSKLLGGGESVHFSLESLASITGIGGGGASRGASIVTRGASRGDASPRGASRGALRGVSRGSLRGASRGDAASRGSQRLRFADQEVIGPAGGDGPRTRCAA